MNNMNLIIGLFILLFTKVYAQWEVQNSRVKVDLNDVCFVDTLYGWAVGDSSTIINTTDGGTNWLKQRSPVDSVWFEKVQFINRNVGYIVGEGGIILSTKDGGNNWKINNSGIDYPIWDLSFIDEENGWAVGADFFKTRYKTVILHTSDGGDNWHKQFEIDKPNSVGVDLFKVVKFMNKVKGWALGGGYMDNFSSTNVYKTIDGGENWDIISKVDFPVVNIDMVGEDTMWIAMYDRCAVSFNGGMEWNYHDPFLGSYVYDIKIFNRRTGWIVVANINEIKICYSDDFGESWKDILKISSKELPISSISVKEDYLWAVGGKGTIIKIKYRDLITFVNSDQFSNPSKDFLQQNYPNPFNSNTIINFYNSSNQYVSINVYDAIGRKISNLLSEFMNVGFYKIIWDGKDQLRRDVSSGIYFIELLSEKNRLIKKSILLR